MQSQLFVVRREGEKAAVALRSPAEECIEAHQGQMLPYLITLAPFGYWELPIHSPQSTRDSPFCTIRPPWPSSSHLSAQAGAPLPVGHHNGLPNRVLPLQNLCWTRVGASLDDLNLFRVRPK